MISRSRPGKSWRGKDAPTLRPKVERRGTNAADLARRERLRRAAARAMFVLALLLAVDASWLHAKAWLAQGLLRSAWESSLISQRAQKPWPWADTAPVARLRAARGNIDQIVLAGDSGRTLAFGPGWAEASAAPGTHGTIVLSGHRDTHFTFLRDLQPGDELQLEARRGQRRYRVVATEVADTRRDAIPLEAHDDALLLVTCWPFDALAPGGPLRYVVRAEPISPSPSGRRWRAAPDEGTGEADRRTLASLRSTLRTDPLPPSTGSGQAKPSPAGRGAQSKRVSAISTPSPSA